MTAIKEFHTSLLALYLELPGEIADDHHVKALAALRELEDENVKLREDRDHWHKEAHDLLKRYEDGHRAFLTIRDEMDKLVLQVHDYQNVVSLAVIDLDVAQQLGVTSNRVESAIRMLREVLTTAGKRDAEKQKSEVCICGQVNWNADCKVHVVEKRKDERETV